MRVAVGDSRTLQLVEGLTRTRLVQYSGASGDYNPMHSDEVYATQVAGYPSVFAHGMLTMGMTGRILTDWFGPSSMARYTVRFRKPVYPGDSLSVTAVVTELVGGVHGDCAEVELTTTDQHGGCVLTGSAQVRLG